MDENKKNILAVDDASFFLTSIKSMLRDSNYNITCINSGNAALNYLKKNQPDLFILDIEMPEMDGYELAKKIREAGQKAPIIFLTGYTSKDSVVKAIKADASDFITKPINQEQLLERIEKYIGI
ncbi:MAG: response regulator [Oscillospiraceae bacterium]|jgi:CheY-like chemotaxis protein|nr:response regulator [Oscillospiraceae bacterium]